jgi:hypothetical protein
MLIPAAASAQEQAQDPACLPQRDGVTTAGIRGVRIGARSRITGPDGRPLKASSATYCAVGGGEISFALSRDDDVVLVTTTSADDMVGDSGAVGPGSPSWAARDVFPAMRRIYRSPTVAIYRTESRSPVLLGIAAGEVRFVAVADRLLLEYRGRLAYYLRRLGH